MKRSTQYLRRFGHVPLPGKNISAIVVLSFCFVFTVTYFFLYTFYISPKLTTVDTFILIIAALLSTVAFCSLLRKPHQFFQALWERIFLPLAFVLAFALRIIGLISGLILRIVRLIFCIGVAVIYDISPIDLIPDFIIGIGWLDDVAVTILMIYIGLFGGRLIVSYGFRSAAENLMSYSAIKTPFP